MLFGELILVSVSFSSYLVSSSTSPTDGYLDGGGFSGLWSYGEVMVFIAKWEIALSVQLYNKIWLTLELSLFNITCFLVPDFLFFDSVVGACTSSLSCFNLFLSFPPGTMLSIFLTCIRRCFILLLHFITLVCNYFVVISSSVLFLFHDIVQQHDHLSGISTKNPYITATGLNVEQITSSMYSSSKHFHMIRPFTLL